MSISKKLNSVNHYCDSSIGRYYFEDKLELSNYLIIRKKFYITSPVSEDTAILQKSDEETSHFYRLAAFLTHSTEQWYKWTYFSSPSH